jgi:hypothetical protein
MNYLISNVLQQKEGSQNRANSEMRKRYLCLFFSVGITMYLCLILYENLLANGIIERSIKVRSHKYFSAEWKDYRLGNIIDRWYTHPEV